MRTVAGQFPGAVDVMFAEAHRCLPLLATARHRSVSGCRCSQVLAGGN